MKCEYCGLIHEAKCPLVKSIEYENGMVKRVEFFAPNDYAPKLADVTRDLYGNPLYPRPPEPYFGAWHNRFLAGVGGADEGSARLV